jgi:hypothetical protein
VSGPLISPRHYVAGVDDFDDTLRVLMRAFEDLKRGTHERAVALFAVIEWCWLNGKPVPWQIGNDLMIAYTTFNSLDKDAATLDAALGLSRPGKAERNASRLTYPSGLSVAAAIVLEVDRMSPPASRDEALFENVGAPMALGASTVKNIYYESRDDLAVKMELTAHAKRSAREAIEDEENREAAARLRARLQPDGDTN